MIDFFQTTVSPWIHTNPILAVFSCFIWGIACVALSPCQLATVSFLSRPSIINSTVNYKILKLMLGHAIALFLVGLILILFSYQLDLLGHYWTVPFGILFLYMAKELLQHDNCTHCGVDHNHSFSNNFLQNISNNSQAFILLGFGYGILSSACALVFLSPILFIAKNQSLSLVVTFNAAFSIGHTLPILIAAMLANSIHKLMCANNSLFKWPRRLVAIAFICLGLILVAHPFLELMGFDFHGHGGHEGHGHEHAQPHNHNEHSGQDQPYHQDKHNHDGHSHDGHSHDEHNHDDHSHDDHSHDHNHDEHKH